MGQGRRTFCLLILAALLSPVALTAQAPSFPWHAGDAPPVIAGLHLKGTRASIDSALGAPDGVQDLGGGMAFLSYDRSHGLAVGYTPADGIAIIHLRARAAGQIDSIRVGDSLATAVRRWGPPTTRDAHVAIYIAGWWAVVLYLDDSDTYIKIVGLGRLAQPGD